MIVRSTYSCVKLMNCVMVKMDNCLYIMEVQSMHWRPGHAGHTIAVREQSKILETSIGSIGRHSTAAAVV